MNEQDVLRLMFAVEVERLKPIDINGLPGGDEYEAKGREHSRLWNELSSQLNKEQMCLLRDLQDTSTDLDSHEKECLYRLGFVRGLTLFDNPSTTIKRAGWSLTKSVMEDLEAVSDADN